MYYNELFYKGSLILLIVFLIALLVVTPADTIHQSFSSGQYWDVIIIIVAYVICAVVCVLFYLQRLLHVRQSLSVIPRRYMLQADDIPSRSVKLITSEFKRCQEVIEKTLPDPVSISHPGYMNPKLVGDDSHVISASYDEIISTTLEYFEAKAVMIHKSFARSVSMSLRDYFAFLSAYKVLDAPPGITYKFLHHYEAIRFSGKPISQADFTVFMEYTATLLPLLKSPDQPRDARSIDAAELTRQTTHSSSYRTDQSIREEILESIGDLARLRPYQTSRTHSRDSSSMIHYPTNHALIPTISLASRVLETGSPNLSAAQTRASNDNESEASFETASSNSNQSVIIRRKK